MFKSVLSVLLLSFLSTALWADLKITNPECRTVILSDDGTWHYAGTPVAESQSEYQKITLSDLKQQFAQHVDQAIKTEGVVVLIIDSFFLKQNIDDETPIEINLAAIPKGIVDKLEQECEQGCAVQAYGKAVMDKDGYKQLILEKLEL